MVMVMVTGLDDFLRCDAILGTDVLLVAVLICVWFVLDDNTAVFVAILLCIKYPSILIIVILFFSLLVVFGIDGRIGIDGFVVFEIGLDLFGLVGVVCDSVVSAVLVVVANAGILGVVVVGGDAAVWGLLLILNVVYIWVRDSRVGYFVVFIVDLRVVVGCVVVGQEAIFFRWWLIDIDTLLGWLDLINSILLIIANFLDHSKRIDLILMRHSQPPNMLISLNTIGSKITHSNIPIHIDIEPILATAGVTQIDIIPMPIHGTGGHILELVDLFVFQIAPWIGLILRDLLVGWVAGYLLEIVLQTGADEWAAWLIGWYIVLVVVVVLIVLVVVLLWLLSYCGDIAYF